MYRQPDAAAHGHAVHEGDVRLLVGRDQVVELVLEAKVGGRFLLALGPRLAEYRELRDVAAGAERLFAGAFEDDDVGELGLAPFLLGERRGSEEGGLPDGGGGGTDLEAWDNFPCHGLVESVVFSGAVELDGSHAELGVKEDVVGLVYGYRRDGHLVPRSRIVSLEVGRLLCGGGDSPFAVLRKQN